MVAEYPHDPGRFTQGLEIEGGQIYESTGEYGKSGLFVNGLRDGGLHAARALPKSVFGEGLTLLAGELFVVTWREGLALVYDRGLHERRRLGFPSEGWGLTHAAIPGAGTCLILSDGSSTLRILEPGSFRQVGAIEVHDSDRPVRRLNELEVARGQIFANVWLTSKIAVIAPETGAVVAWLDLADLEQRIDRPAGRWSQDNVLNGIAYDPPSGHFFVTGKRWPKLFEINVSGQLPDGAGHPIR